MGLIPGARRHPGEGSGRIVFFPGKCYGQRRMVGYRSGGHKELDMT